MCSVFESVSSSYVFLLPMPLSFKKCSSCIQIYCLFLFLWMLALSSCKESWHFLFFLVGSGGSSAQSLNHQAFSPQSSNQAFSPQSSNHQVLSPSHQALSPLHSSKCTIVAVGCCLMSVHLTEPCSAQLVTLLSDLLIVLLCKYSVSSIYVWSFSCLM